MFKTIKDLINQDIEGKVIFVRADLNVPIKDGKITDATRIEKFAPTALALSDAGAKVIISSHLGRPDGKKDPQFSMEQLGEELANELDQEVSFVDDCIGQEVKDAIAEMEPGDFLLLENLRFYAEEEACDDKFSQELASLADFYVNDAFATAHRAHASTFGITKYLPSYAGLLMESELSALGKIFHTPTKPVAAIVGGAKVSTKITVLENLMNKVDYLFIGGAMANTFLMAQGHNMGKSLVEADMLDIARTVMAKAEGKGCKIILPTDLVVAKEFKAYEGDDIKQVHTVGIDAVPADCMALDFGPDTIDMICDTIEECKTIVWNGPFGAFEMEPFEQATFEIADFIGDQTEAGELESVAGGGDTVSALNISKNADRMTYVSTAGGAFLEYMEGKELPGVKALEK